MSWTAHAAVILIVLCLACMFVAAMSFMRVDDQEEEIRNLRSMNTALTRANQILESELNLLLSGNMTMARREELKKARGLGHK